MRVAAALLRSALIAIWRLRLGDPAAASPRLFLRISADMFNRSPGAVEIVVRPLSRQDAPALHAAVRDSIASLSAAFPWCRPGYGLADAQARVAHCEAAWERGSEFPFGIFDDRGKALLGCAGLNQVDAGHRSANLGYWVGEAHRRRGIAVAAATQVARFGFGPLGLVRIEIVTTPGNHASQAVAEKLGATREAVARNRLVVRGVPTDALVYSLVPADLADPGVAPAGAGVRPCRTPGEPE